MNHLLIDYLTITFKFTREFKSFICPLPSSKDFLDFEKDFKSRDIFSDELIDKLGISVAKVNSLTSSFFDVYFRSWIVKKLHLPFEKFKVIKSRLFYDAAFTYNGITLHMSDSVFCFEASGIGCRKLEDLNPDLDWYALINSFDYMIRFLDKDKNSPPVHIARLDIALDDIGNKIVTLPLLLKYERLKKYVCRASFVLPMPGTHEQSIYFGSPSSSRRLRIYDKRMEQRGLESDIPWVRYEFQLRDESALSFYFNLCNCNGDFPKCYFGILHDFLRFTTKSRLAVGHHTDRLVTVKWWLSLVQKAEKIKQIYLPGSQYSLKTIQNFFNKQCLSTTKTVLIAEWKKTGDFSSFLNMVLDAELNDKQIKSLEQFFNDCGERESYVFEYKEEYKEIYDEYRRTHTLTKEAKKGDMC